MRAKKKLATEHQPSERRFVPDPTYAGKLSTITGMVGAFALGAGVYGKWVMENAPAYAPVLLVGGAAILGGSLWFADARVLPVRIGDTGIALERSGDIVRLAWCDLTRVFVAKDQLVAEGKALSLHLPLRAHALAAAWLLSEGTRRVPAAMDVKASVLSRLPKPKEGDGDNVPLEGVQIAGRVCAASGKPITFERDARLCPVCGQVYHKDQVPKQCATCNGELAGRSISL